MHDCTRSRWACPDASAGIGEDLVAWVPWTKPSRRSTPKGMSYVHDIVGWFAKRFADPAKVTASDVNDGLRVLTVWRSRALASEFARRQGLTIWQGPFAGMAYVGAATEGALLPRLIGTYEQELHSAIEAFVAAGLDCVIDVGCAEGYYAVGLARRMPGVEIHARDTDSRAQEACAELARRNGVEAQLRIGGPFTPADFQAFAHRRCLVVCDIEGAEDDLVRPDLAPALAGMSLIVESHECYKPGLTDRLISRFAPTHDIERFEMGPRTLPLPDWFAPANHMDRLIAVWEWRAGPTPWLVMRPKAG